MTILSLTLFRRREEPYRTYREDASTRGDKVLNRLQQMLVVDTVSREQIEENEVNEKTRSDAGADLAAANPRGDDPGDTSAAPELTASNVVSAVAFLTPADEIEVERLSVPAPIDEDTAEALASLGLESAAPNTTKWTQEDEDTDNRVTIALDEAHAEAIARQLKRFSNRPCTTWGGRGTSAHTDAGGPMRAYSMDLRERALLDSDAGMKAADVAAKYRVSGSWVRLLKQRRRDTGEVAPRVQRQGRRGMLEPHLHTLAALIAAHPDRTLAELQDALATPASVPTVWRAVRALGLTVKKNGPPVRTRSA